MKTIQQALLDKIVYIGEDIPESVANDKRSKFVLLGNPQELIDEVKKLCVACMLEKEGLKTPAVHICDKDET